MEGVLVVAVCTKKDYMAVALQDYPLADSCWVSVDTLEYIWCNKLSFSLENKVAVNFELMFIMFTFVVFKLLAWHFFLPSTRVFAVLYSQHSVAIVHIPGRRPFGQNLVTIYIDGELRKTAQLRFPSFSEVTETSIACILLLERSSSLSF